MSTELEKSLATVARGAGIIFIGLIIGNFLGMINQVILGRFLGPANYGILNLAISVVVIIGTFASFGLIGALPVCIPHHHEKNQNDIVKSIIRFSLKLVLISSIFIGVVLWILSDIIAVNIFHESNLIVLLKFFAFCFPFLVLPNILHAILRAFGGVKHKVYLYDIGTPLTKILIFILFIIAGNRLFGAAIAYIGGFIVVLFVSMYLIQKRYFPFLSAEYEKASVGKKLLSFSWPLALTGVTFLFISKTDIVLLGYYMSSKDVGIYTAALSITGMLTFVGSAFEWIFLPVISKYFATGQLDELKSLFKSSSKWMFLIVLPVFLFILLFSEEIIRLLFGVEYVEGSLALIILAFGISMNMLTGLTGNMLVGSGHTKLNLLSEIIGGITNISLNIMLIPIYGIIGAAIGTAASYFTRNLSSLAFVYKTTKTHPFKKSHINIIISGIVVLMIVYFIKIQIYSFFIWWIGLILLGIALFALYIVLILFSRCIDENDKFILKAVGEKLGLRTEWLERFI